MWHGWKYLVEIHFCSDNSRLSSFIQTLSIRIKRTILWSEKYNECNFIHDRTLILSSCMFELVVFFLVFIYLGAPESHWRLPAAQREGPGRRAPQRCGDPEPFRRQLWLWRGAARVAPPERAAGTGPLAGRSAAGQHSACHPDSGDHEAAHRPRSGPGSSSVCGESHGTAAGAAHCVRALGGQSQQSPQSQVRAALNYSKCSNRRV